MSVFLLDTFDTYRRESIYFLSQSSDIPISAIGELIPYCQARDCMYNHFAPFAVFFLFLCLSLHTVEPTSVAQLDARPTEDQDVAGSNPAGSATFFRGG